MVACYVALTLTACANNPAAPGSTSSPGPLVEVASVDLHPASMSLESGQSTLLQASVKDKNGNNVTVKVAWSTSDASVATVDSTGTVRATGSGKATIKASSHGKGSHTRVKVSSPPVSGSPTDTSSTSSSGSAGTVATITLTPRLDTLAVSETVNLTMVPRDASGHILTGISVSWSSSNTSVATVDGGLVTAKGAGSATITAYSGGVSGTSSIVVTGDASSSGSQSTASVAMVQVTPGSVTLDPGQTIDLTATPLDASGNVVYGVGVTWSTTNASVATVSGGKVTAVNAGSAKIVALAGGMSGSASVTVNDPPVSAAPTPSGDALLNGCTVSESNNTPSCSTPSGWTLIAKEGFGGGSVHQGEIDTGQYGPAIDCGFSHTGSCSLRQDISGDGGSYRNWHIKKGTIGSRHEIYVSYWEYLTTGATEQVNFFMVLADNQGSHTANSPYEYVLQDRWGDVSTSANSTTCKNGVGPYNNYKCQSGHLVVESVCAPCTNNIARSYYGNWRDMAVGKWVHFEWHYKANTQNGAGGNADGEIQLFVNGVSELHKTGVVINGPNDMTGMYVQVGGYYMARWWTNSAGNTCSAVDAAGAVYHFGQFTQFNPPCPQPSSFKRYMDDIIVLAR